MSRRSPCKAGSGGIGSPSHRMSHMESNRPSLPGLRDLRSSPLRFDATGIARRLPEDTVVIRQLD